MQIRDLIEELQKADPKGQAGFLTNRNQFFEIDSVVIQGSRAVLKIPRDFQIEESEDE